MAIILQFHSTQLKDPLYTSQGPHCVEFQYLLNVPECDPTLLSSSCCSQEEQDGLCTSLISFLTLGMMNIQPHPDFLVISDRFNVAFESCGTKGEVHHVLEYFETLCKELIITSYDCPIKAVADILSHLCFTKTNATVNPWGENEEIITLITQFITHYPTQSGHPSNPDRVFHALLEGDATAGSVDPLLHARLFLSVLTGSALLPLDNSWSIKGSITHDWDEMYPASDPDGDNDYGPETWITFKSCFKTFTILNNARLRFLLLSEFPVDGQSLWDTRDNTPDPKLDVRLASYFPVV
ncbi:hypothetical protein B0H10DRAFT_2225819 [Mycena sp. CBHHK59/15]|nr:hypothetical protein B0H10DRAFT_2225819 [Mycena sp. CBHHK59/15]